MPAGDNVVRLLPPLIVTDEEIREAVGRIRAARGQASPRRPQPPQADRADSMR